MAEGITMRYALFVPKRRGRIDAESSPDRRDGGRDRYGGKQQQTGHKGEGIPGREALEGALGNPDGARSQGGAASRTDSKWQGLLPQHDPQDVQTAGSERHPHTDFASSLGYGEGQQPEDADHGEQTGNGCQRTHNFDHLADSVQTLVDDALEVEDQRDDAGYGGSGPERSGHCSGWIRRPHPIVV